MLGKATEDTVMELDGEHAANFHQLKDLIRKECDKQDHHYLLSKKNIRGSNMTLQQVINNKKHATEGPHTNKQPRWHLKENKSDPNATSTPRQSHSRTESPGSHHHQ